jgi:hypothetical protein
MEGGGKVLVALSLRQDVMQVLHVSFASALIHSIHTCMAFTGTHVSAVPSAALIDFGKPVYLHT